jgi:hypothetical protein
VPGVQVLFFQKRTNLFFLKKKKQKDFWSLAFAGWQSGDGVSDKE